MKILIGKFGHEANTFSGRLTDYAQFAASGMMTRGAEILPRFRGTPDYLGGMIDAAEARGAALIPSVACLTAAPTLSASCALRVLEELLACIRANLDGLDGICLALHGAGCAEFTDDLEGYVLRRVRAVTGSAVPVMVTLDLHANVSPAMHRLADGLFGIKQYPHTDMYEAGRLAMEELIRTAASGEPPQCAVCPLPLLVPPAAGCTAAEPMRSITAHLAAYRAAHGLVDVTLFHGFPPADTPHTRACVAVVARTGAQEAARELAAYVWSQRHALSVTTLTAEQAMAQAAAVRAPGCVVINEFSDNPGGGAPGDGTHLLREMLRRDLPGSIFGYLCDPAAVEEIFRRRVGDRIRLRLGGRTEPVCGAPLELEAAEILCMSSGEFRYVSPVHAGLPDTIGRCARLRQGNVEFIVGSVLHQTYDDRPFLVTGADVFQYRYAGLKSAHHFRAFFAPRAAAIVTADPPGLMCGDLGHYAFRHLPRPLYPLDADAEAP